MAAGFKQRKNRSILHDQLSYHINYGKSAGPAEANLLEEVLEGLRRYRRGEYEK
jgi:ligand-binding SRPBCC domain-containing protein